MATKSLSDLRRSFYGTTAQELAALEAAFTAGKTVSTLLGAGDWVPYTPVWSGTLGNGTLTGRYSRVGKTITYEIRLTWGTTTSHPAAIQTFSLPTPPATTSGYAPIGHAVLEQAGVSLFDRTAVYNQDLGAVTANRDNTAATNTVPFTWANTHKAYFRGSYEAAA